MANCDNCGADLAGADNPVETEDHEFCGPDCAEEYAAEHSHEEEEEQEVCEFC
ncbi:MAG: hypothetical protein SVY41_00875 [Candidatus Nanohaloarchaea archaeon]|nr:hypothetical protein [Candidatus Nanohaloarchaea archaeon]